MMARLTFFLLALAQRTFVQGLPVGESKQASAALNERAITLVTNLQPTISYSTAIESLQSVSMTATPTLTGIVHTELPFGGFTRNPIQGPGETQSNEPLRPNETPLDPGPTAPVAIASKDIFQPIATGGPASSIPLTGGHVVHKKHIVDGDMPIQTNKFYANFFLGSQSFPVWTHPYSLTWARGAGNSYGMAVSHVERDKFAFGGGPSPDKPQYFIAPLGIYSMVLSAAELGRDTYLSVESLKAFSVYANLAASAGSRVLMSIPCVQGMGFVTAIYDKAKPVINTGVFFRTLDYVKSINGATHKYRVQLNDGTKWLLYVTPTASQGVPPFSLVDSSTITGPADFVGMIQITKNPADTEGEPAFDSSAGAYAINATVSGSANGASGSYSLAWAKGGVQSQTLLMYALPHHVESFDEQTKAALKSNIKLVTTTKGFATAVVADRITMIEDDLPDTIGFAPWAKASNGGAGGSENTNLNSGARAMVNEAGNAELSQDMNQQTRLNSMYYSGKGLAKFATVIYTMNSMAGNGQLAAAGLDRLKDAFNVFVNNTQPEPLYYDTVWKGVVSSATYRPPYDTGLDFGNTLYNDHHFHYGYFVWTAAVIGHLDPKWLDQGSNKAWVNTLVRDFANPVNDGFYPFSRSFDWFHGHSWAKGLFESGDGKDQESTSEDTFASHAMKMWGKITRDPNMEARGNLQLAIQARSMKNYFLMTSDNKNQPPQFLQNKATGILFENKIDHVTYFGANTEFIEGIHMIPLNPSSAYTRSRQFVQEEWDRYFSNGRVDQVQGGWKSIIYANLALIDPQRAYDFFANPNFSEELDGGASRTWYLAYTAAMMNAGTAQAQQDTDLNYEKSGTTDSKPKAKDGDAEPHHDPPKDDEEDFDGDSTKPVKTESKFEERPMGKGKWPVGFDWPKRPSVEPPQTEEADEPTESQYDAANEDEDTVDNDWATDLEQNAFNEDEDVVVESESLDMTWALQDEETFSVEGEFSISGLEYDGKEWDAMDLDNQNSDGEWETEGDWEEMNEEW